MENPLDTRSFTQFMTYRVWTRKVLASVLHLFGEAPWKTGSCLKIHKKNRLSSILTNICHTSFLSETFESTRDLHLIENRIQDKAKSEPVQNLSPPATFLERTQISNRFLIDCISCVAPRRVSRGMIHSVFDSNPFTTLWCHGVARQIL